VLVVAREPMIADIRFAWWRETIEGARSGNPRPHAVAKALAETFSAVTLPGGPFDRMIDGWSNAREPFASEAQAVENADARVGSLMRLAALVLGEDADFRDCAIAYALAGRHDDIFSGIDTDALAKHHFAAARRIKPAKAQLPVIMPVSLVPLYVKQSTPPLWRKQIAYLGVALRGCL
jgi:hypothetical protein